MLDAKSLKDRLTVGNIIQLMEEMGANGVVGSNENEILFQTICHGGDSHKLYFYKDTKTFYCYTNCGALDIFNIIENVYGFNLQESMNYVCNKFGIYQMFSETFGDTVEVDANWSIINSYNRGSQREVWKEFNIIDEKTLNKFYDFYHPNFLNDNIDKFAMNKFEIKFDILNNRIIIPHRNDNGDLIAIRCRNLDTEMVEGGRKYMPITIDKKLLSAPSKQYFYGLYQNKENIKKHKRVILVESEKAVLQYESYFPSKNICLALSGSNLSDFQKDILIELGVREVVVALDKEYVRCATPEEKLYIKKVNNMIVNKLNCFDVSVMWDFSNLLNLKDSPLDKGKEVFETLYKNKINKFEWEMMCSGN